MTPWSKDELRKFAEADELHISPFRADGMAYRAPIHELVDDAYRAKYHGSAYLGPMIGARARSATVKVMPRESKALSSSFIDNGLTQTREEQLNN